MPSQQNDKSSKEHKLPVFLSRVRIVFIPLVLISLCILAFIWIRGVSSDLDKEMTATFVSLTAIFAFLAMPFLYHRENSQSPVSGVSTPISPVPFNINNQFQPNAQQPSLMPTAISTVVYDKEPDNQARPQTPTQAKQQQSLEIVSVVNQPLSPALHQSNELIAHSSPTEKRNVPATRKAVRTFTEQERRKLVDLLFACPTMSRKESRDVVVGDLRETVKGSMLRDYQNDKLDIRHIIDACLNTPGGLEALIDIVKYSEGDSIPFRDLEEFLKQIQVGV
jgi:hypothetical protein